MNVSFTHGSGLSEAEPHNFSLSWNWKRTDFTKLWAKELWLLWHWSTDSASVSLLCLFVPACQPQFDFCSVAHSTHQRAAQASFTLPLEGALQSKLQTMQGKWFLFYWEYKMFYQNPFIAWWSFFFIYLLCVGKCMIVKFCTEEFTVHTKFDIH